MFLLLTKVDHSQPYLGQPENFLLNLGNQKNSEEPENIWLVGFSIWGFYYPVFNGNSFRSLGMPSFSIEYSGL